MTRAVWISALVHGAAILTIDHLFDDDPREAVDRRPVTEPENGDAIEIETLEIVRPPLPAATDEPTLARITRGDDQRVAAAIRRTIGAVATTPIERSPSEPSRDRSTSALAMRGLRHDLALSADTARRIAGANGLADGREQPGEPRWSHDPKIELRDGGRGKRSVLDPTGTFHVAPDGTVDIAHAPDFSFELNLPTPAIVEQRWRLFKKDFKRWLADPYRDTRVGRSQDLPNHLLAVPGACDRFGAPECFTAKDQQDQWEREDDGLHTGIRGVAGGRFDLTGYLHRKYVGDPYASRKLKILDQTRDERARAGGVYRAEQLDRSAELVQLNLEALWRHTPDPAERRAALFAVWDECEEGASMRGEAGERARKMIIGWIRAKLPRGTEGAFTADEIAKHDGARRSQQRFVPYEP